MLVTLSESSIFEELAIFGHQNQLPRAILLQIHPLSALYDPWGSRTRPKAVRAAQGYKHFYVKI